MREKFLKIWKEKLMLGIILLLITIAVRFVCYQVIEADYEYFYDTSSYSYLEGYQSEFGEINAFRTPVYPIFLKIVGIFGDDSVDELYANVTAVQEIISLISVAFFYLLMRKLTKSKVTQSIATLYYGCLPSIFTYNLCILTESLAISLVVFFLYIFCCYLEKKKISQQILLAALTLIMILLRPTFLCLLIFFAIFWIFQFFIAKEERKKTGIGALSTVVVCLILGGYSWLNQVQNGFMGLSYVNIINQTDIILDMKLYGSYENNPIDDQITQIIVENYDATDAPWYVAKDKVLEQFSYETLGEYNQRCIKHNLKSYLIGQIRRIVELGSTNINTALVNRDGGKIQSYLIAFSQCVFPLNIGFLFLIIGFELIYFLWKCIRKEKWKLIEQMRFFAMILMAGILSVTLLGAQAEYTRLIVPILSICILLVAESIEKIWKKRRAEAIE